MHIEQVLGNVPKAQRCQCKEAGQQAASAKTPDAKAAEHPSWLRQLFKG
jgi:hypothetical protein